MNAPQDKVLRRSLAKLKATAKVRYPSNAPAQAAYVQRVLDASEGHDVTAYTIRESAFHALRHELGERPRIDTDWSRLYTLRPGDVLTVAIYKITDAIPCAKCAERRALMNDRGWVWCWNNRRTIAAWLADACRDRGHDMTGPEALALLRAAWAELRKKRKQRHKDDHHGSHAPPTGRTREGVLRRDALRHRHQRPAGPHA